MIIAICLQFAQYNQLTTKSKITDLRSYHRVLDYSNHFIFVFDFSSSAYTEETLRLYYFMILVLLYLFYYPSVKKKMNKQILFRLPASWSRGTGNGFVSRAGDLGFKSRVG